MRDQGMNSVDAVCETVRSRMRPILMSTLTTVLGMLPLVVPARSERRVGLERRCRQRTLPGTGSRRTGRTDRLDILHDDPDSGGFQSRDGC